MTTQPSDIVVLNDGTIVTFLKEISHEAEVARRDKMYEGVMLEPDAEGGFKTNGIPFANYVKATEICMPYLITKIEAAGTVIAYSEQWLNKLTETDYKKLKAHVDKMVGATAEKVQEGKKNS